MISLVLSLALFQATETVPQSIPDEPVPAPAEAAAEAPATETPDTEAALDGINAYLNSIETLRARFNQVAPDGSLARGHLVLSRPGRLRFDYDDPSPIRVIADGTTIAIQDMALETVDRVPLRSTPLWWILKPEIDLAADANIVSVESEFGFLYVTLEDPDQDVQGQIMFVFAEPNYELREWYVTDALGEITRVSLADMETGIRVNPRNFVIPEPEDRRDSRRGRR